jgi:hypothetical protein
LRIRISLRTAGSLPGNVENVAEQVQLEWHIARRAQRRVEPVDVPGHERGDARLQLGQPSRGGEHGHARLAG